MHKKGVQLVQDVLNNLKGIEMMYGLINDNIHLERWSSTQNLIIAEQMWLTFRSSRTMTSRLVEKYEGQDHIPV